MKKSIKSKLFIDIIVLVFIFVLIFWTVNSLFYGKYYLYKKKSALIDESSKINEDYKGNIDNIDGYLEEIENSENANVTIYNRERRLIYSTYMRTIRNFDPISNDFFSHYQGEYEFAAVIEDIEDIEVEDAGDRAVIEIISDKRLNIEFLRLTKLLDHGELLIIRVPLTQYSESINITNNFVLYTAILFLIIGIAWALVLSERFTIPILELNSIARRMAGLDFSRKYTVKNDDEIGQLGKSINYLSKELKRSIEELNEKNKLQSEFIYAVSHELKTPISLIQGYAEGLKYKVSENEEDRNFYCNVIIDENNKMDKIVRELLQILEMDSDKYHLNEGTFDIVTLVSYTLEKFKNVFRENSINVQFNDSGHIEVIGDPSKIEQVITNYLTNAINHVDENRIIRVLVEDFERLVKVKIYNSGKNISPDNMEKIWEPFYKIDKSRTRRYGGTGLGLSIVKSIQEKHGNEYGVFNGEDGVWFWFTIKKERV